MTPRICLGTAQFGLTYGITNSSGQVSEQEVRALLSKANEARISFIDTAQSYGNAESILGQSMPLDHDFQLVCKLRAQKKVEFTEADFTNWEEEFRASCDRLGLKQINSMLLHSAKDLKKPGGHFLLQWLQDLRTRGLVQRIGLSIYSADDLAGVDLAALDLVQLPFSLYDQRLLRDGTLFQLSQNGIAIHARSVFLQGLLLTPTCDWPTWVDSKILHHHHQLEALALKRGCTLVNLALGFAQSQKYLEAVVFGVCSSRELSELLDAWKEISPWQEDEWLKWQILDPSSLDPRRWPS